MDKEKNVNELEGWTEVLSIRSFFGSRYKVYRSPDGKRFANVHLEDGDVALIFDREEKKIVYLHPTTELGMQRMGMPKEKLERILSGAVGRMP